MLASSLGSLVSASKPELSHVASAGHILLVAKAIPGVYWSFPTTPWFPRAPAAGRSAGNQRDWAASPRGSSCFRRKRLSVPALCQGSSPSCLGAPCPCWALCRAALGPASHRLSAPARMHSLDPSQQMHWAADGAHLMGRKESKPNAASVAVERGLSAGVACPVVMSSPPGVLQGDLPGRGRHPRTGEGSAVRRTRPHSPPARRSCAGTPTLHRCLDGLLSNLCLLCPASFLPTLGILLKDISAPSADAM
nr:PRELI domain containing protein 3A isoform X1 [Oryctolagus cuniculus]